MTNQKHYIVKLIEPEICKECRFHALVRIRDGAGDIRDMNQCLRTWCDNHILITAPGPEEQVSEVVS